MLFPFIDYRKSAFSTTSNNVLVTTMTYRALIVVEVTNNNAVFGGQRVFIESGGAIDVDIDLYATGSTFTGGGAHINIGRNIRVDANGSTLAGNVHIFRLPDDIA